MKSTADTPLGRALRHLGITQSDLALRLGIRDSSASRIVRHGQVSPLMAVRVLDAVDGLRYLIDERHLLYPKLAPFREWKPPQSEGVAVVVGK